MEKKRTAILGALLGVQVALALFAHWLQWNTERGYGMGYWLGACYLLTAVVAVWQMKDSRPWLSAVKVGLTLLAIWLPFLASWVNVFGLYIPQDQNLGGILFGFLAVAVGQPLLAIEATYALFNHKWRVAAQPAG